MENMVINRGNHRQISVTVLGANGVKIELSKCTDVELILWINGRSKRANNTQILNDILVAELTASELDYLGEYSAQVKYTDNGVVSTSERVYLFRVANEFYRTASGTGLSDGGTLEISVSTPIISYDKKLVADAEKATSDANTAASAANTAASNANNKADLANTAALNADIAKTNAEKATADANTATLNATNAANTANAKAIYANEQGDYAKQQGLNAVATANEAASNAANAAFNASQQAAYAKQQGDYAKAEAEGIDAKIATKANQSDLVQLEQELNYTKDEIKLKRSSYAPSRSDYEAGATDSNDVTTLDKLHISDNSTLRELYIYNTNSVSTDIIICIGNIISGLFVKYSSFVVTLPIHGWNTITGLSISVKSDSYIAIDNNSYVPFKIDPKSSDIFMQYPTSVGGSTTSLNGYVGVGYLCVDSTIRDIIDDLSNIKGFTSNQSGEFTTHYGGGSNKNVTTAQSLQALRSGYVDRIEFNADASSQFAIAVGYVNNGEFTIRKSIDIVVSITGKYIVNPVNLYINEGEYIAIWKDGSRFGFSLSSKNDKFLQFPVNGSGLATVSMDGSVSLAYRITTESSVIDRNKELSNYGHVIGTHSISYSVERSSYVEFLEPNRWITNNYDDIIVDGDVRNINIDVRDAGTYTFGVGLIDQRGWAIIDNEFTLDLNAGVNNISASSFIGKNKRLFIKSPIAIGVNSSNDCYLSTSSNSISLSQQAGKLCFSYEVFGNLYYESNNVNRDEFSSFKSATELSILNINAKTLGDFVIKSPNKYFRLKCDDNGALSTELIQSKKIAVLGNSFEKHPISPVWWGEWGMAASRRELDWVHQLQSKLLSNGIATNIEAQNIAEWETSASTFDYSSVNNTINNADLVIIRIGENNPNTATLTQDTINLINHVKTQVPTAKIIFGGLFWRNNDIQNKMKAGVDTFTDIPFIEFQHLDTSEYKAKIGDVVYGDDGQYHTIEHAGVANHAGDKGMEAMAELILPHAIIKLR